MHTPIPGTCVAAYVNQPGTGRDTEGFASDAFDYLIVDQAHHAPADTYVKVLQHFRPGFILGLTARQPENNGGRPDGKSVLDFFQDSCHRMTLEEAVARANCPNPMRAR